MELNDLRDHHDEHKEEKVKFEYEKYSTCPYQYNCPMYGNPMHCPMFQTQHFTPMMPGPMRDDMYSQDENSWARPYHPRPFYPRPYYPRPFFYPGPFYPGLFPYFFPFFL